MTLLPNIFRWDSNCNYWLSNKISHSVSFIFVINQSKFMISRLKNILL